MVRVVELFITIIRAELDLFFDDLAAVIHEAKLRMPRRIFKSIEQVNDLCPQPAHRPSFLRAK